MEEQNEWQNEWLFPVRMENGHNIEWKPNIVEVLAAFKKPVDQLSWDKLLRRGALSAGTPEDQAKLERWWIEGWKETPTLPPKRSASIPVLYLEEKWDGQHLALVYPSLTIAAEALGTYKRHIILSDTHNLTRETPNKLPVRLMRRHGLQNVYAREDIEWRWTIFAADNTIIGHFRTKQEAANFLGVTAYDLDRAHKYKWNEIDHGIWVWNEEWGLMPISPQDEPLGKNWREKYAPKP